MDGEEVALIGCLGLLVLILALCVFGLGVTVYNLVFS